MRDYKTTRFVKIIRINKEHYEFIKRMKSKKSSAGRLEEIINFYKNNIDKYGGTPQTDKS